MVESLATSRLYMTQKDIPGAQLEDVTAASVIQLKRWLACRRGASTSGNKAELVKRVNDYIKGGLDVDLLIDPDSGSNLKQKKAGGELVFPSSTVTLSSRIHHPPEEGWTSDLSKVPTGLCFGNMWHFLVNQPHLQEKTKGCDKQFGKGYRLYCSGHVTEVKYHPMSSESEFIYLKATVLPSMKKSTQYTTYISLWQSTLCIHSAYCSCPAGLSGICCHVAAFLYACTNSSNSTNTTNVSCTSLPQQWHLPSRKRKVNNFPIHEALFQKHDPIKRNKRKPKIRQVDPRPISLRHNRDRVFQLRQKLESLESQGKPCAFLHVLPFAPSLSAIHCDHNYSTPPSKQQDSFITSRDVPNSSVPQSEVSTQAQQTTYVTSTSTLQGILPNHHQLKASLSPSEKMSLDEEFNERCVHYEKTQRLTSKELEHIEQATMGQSGNENWFKHRQGKVTASVVGTIINQRKTTPPDNIVRKIMGYEKQTNVPKACKHGIEFEPKAAEAYVEYMKMNGHPVISVKETGLALMPDHSWLGASVDRIVDDPASQPKEGIAEIKSPASNLTISELAIKRGSSFPLYRNNTGAFKLKPNHIYYYQIQCQMAVTKREWCDFIMYTQTPQGSDIYVERILFDENKWRRIIFPKLKAFYIESVVPEILTGRVKLGYPLCPERFQYKCTKKINVNIEE